MRSASENELQGSLPTLFTVAMETVYKGGYAYPWIRTFSNGNNVIEKIAKYLILGMLGLAALTFVAVLVLDDEMIESTAGGGAEYLLGIKHGTIDTVTDKSESFVYWIRTSIHDIMTFSPTDRTPRVVMRIPPPPENIARAPAPPPAPAPKPAPPTSTESMPATLPETSLQVPTESSESSMPSAPESATAMAEATTAHTETPPPPMPSALGNGTPAMEGAPPPVPVTGVTEQPLPMNSTEPVAATEQAALSDSAAPTDSPPPPPAPQEQQPGEADYQLGLQYYNGDGVEQNFGKAVQFFLKAGEAGHVGAQYNLGIMNYTGQTGGQDFVNAAKWFERAAINGHTQAQYNLGFLYYEGKGVAQDLRTAFDWINRAAEQGYPKAIKARDAFKQAMPEMFPTQPAKPAS